MIYLNKGSITPLLIIYSLIFIPIITALIIALFLAYNIGILIVFIGFTIIYILSIILIICNGNSKKYYIEMQGVNCIIKHHKLGKSNPNILELNIAEIQCFEYYKIKSFKNWFLMLMYYSIPNSLCIQYCISGINKFEFIGYMKKKQVVEFCNTNNIKLVIH